MKYVTRCRRHFEAENEICFNYTFLLSFVKDESIGRTYVMQTKIYHISTIEPVEHITFTYVPEWAGVTGIMKVPQ